MYYYIFDPKSGSEEKYFDKIQGRLLNRLAELRIDGESSRVTPIRTMDLLVDQAIGANAKTLVVVGSDQSLNRVINSLVRKQVDLTLGYIPLDRNSDLAKILGVDVSAEEAAQVIASRLTSKVYLGSLGEFYFLSRVDLGPNFFTELDNGFMGLRAAREIMSLEPFHVELVIKKSGRSVKVSSEVLAAQIVNSRCNDGCKLKLGDPTEQVLDVLLLNQMSSSKILRNRNKLATGCIDSVPGSTVMHADVVEVAGPRKLPLSVEGKTYTKAPATISSTDKSLTMIVGKKRQF